ncbi:pyridoxal-phosphate dependent enzyme [Capillimicrobium parvum]|uniref:Diaminopropionate ammonia-lyase n=1 Tax=Capillimicrobium parvum TaxID=2884022 RepID=A0A9E6XVX0_9ACTN|nr:pyridoxal-phosphate dependent enzyme [Capillimicrobium parvum]UGS35403.1 Diaminopropionate ammonia-lyase [Capillimicrobium parvum]
MRWLANPHRDPALRPGDDDAPLRFHRSLDGYAPSPLVDAPQLAGEWGVGRVLLKFERERFGLPAFKFLGASWAARRLLGEPPYDPDLELVAATDGNHGRAVARVARLAGLGATILVPAGTAAARIDAIAGEGARVEVVDGTYDDAVRRSATLASPRRLVLSDTSWPGYEDVPRWVIEGYATIFREVDEQTGGARVDLAVIPIGVGALAAAAVRHLGAGATLAGVEPESAACVLESIAAGKIVEVPGPHTSIMAGLNAGLPSLVAWPAMRDGFDVLCAVTDDVAEAGMRRLAALGLEAGEVSGGTAGATGALLADPGARAALRAGPETSVLLVLTEGVTDPANYARIVGGGAESG